MLKSSPTIRARLRAVALSSLVASSCGGREVTQESTPAPGSQAVTDAGRKDEPQIASEPMDVGALPVVMPVRPMCAQAEDSSHAANADVAARCAPPTTFDRCDAASRPYYVFFAPQSRCVVGGPECPSGGGVTFDSYTACARACAIALDPAVGSCSRVGCDAWCPLVPGIPAAISMTTPFGPVAFDHAWLTEVRGFTESSTLWFTQGPTFFADTLPMLTIDIDRLNPGSGYNRATVALCGGTIAELPVDVSYDEPLSAAGTFTGKFRIDTGDFVAEGTFSFPKVCRASTDT